MNIIYLLNNEPIFKHEEIQFPQVPPLSKGQHLEIYRDGSVRSYSVKDITLALTLIKGELKQSTIYIHLTDPSKKSASKDTAYKGIDFEVLWKLYPRKQGRAEAEKHFKAQIKTPEDYKKLKEAIEYYAAQCISESLAPRFILMGKTFFNKQWLDYYAESQASKPEPESQTKKGKFEFFKPPSED